jgi:ankyrin repeat protein
MDMSRGTWFAVLVVLGSAAGCASLPRKAHDGDLKALEEYLANGGSVDARFAESGGCTLLHPAADGGQTTVVSVLLERGADPNAVAAYGYTPLHMAAAQHHAEVVRVLLEHGAKPSLEMRDQWGNTPLLLAVGKVKTTEAWVITPFGPVSTETRARAPSFETLEVLLDAGADLNAPTAQGNTPLHIAAYKGYTGVVGLLLARGANRTARNRLGLTPEELAREFKQDAVVALLRAE